MGKKGIAPPRFSEKPKYPPKKDLAKTPRTPPPLWISNYCSSMVLFINHPCLFSSLFVRFGDLNLAANYEGEELIAQQRKIIKITKHPKVSMGVLNITN